MLIKENSILRTLPIMPEKDLLILDSIRFSADMIQHCFDQLEVIIINLSESTSKKDVPNLFLYAWNIIDHVQRMLKLLTNLQSRSNHDRVRKIIESIRLPRNTYQHLDERVDKVLINQKSPFFGRLKWCYSYTDGSFVDIIAISGIYYSESNTFRFGEFSKVNKIQNIILETVDRNQEIEINLSLLKIDCAKIISLIEEDLLKQIQENQLSPINRTSVTDIIFKLKQNQK